MKRLTAIIALFGLLAGCTTLADLQEAKEAGKEGITMSYPVTYDRAWDISRAIFRWNGCEAIEEHRSEGYMLTSTGLSAMSWGTLMGAWLKPAGDGTEVTVVTKRKFKADLVNELSEDSFHTSFAEAMKIVKAGKKLPFRPPVNMSTQSPTP